MTRATISRSGLASLFVVAIMFLQAHTVARAEFTIDSPNGHIQLAIDDTAMECRCNNGTFDGTHSGNGALLTDVGNVQDNGVLKDKLNLIVQASQCLGGTCLDSPGFGFSTLLLSENNLRITFDDSSSLGTFPKNDWEIIINDATDGGESYFAIHDKTGDKTPFQIEAGANANALYVESTGDVGFGTNDPQVDIHIIDGDTPTVRFEQTTDGGFPIQSWDVAGNEANFFVRDNTNAAQLPFRIRPGAKTSSLDIAASGWIGMGDAAPNAPLHMKTSEATNHFIRTENDV
eukprot:TRINITY_DN1229_c0_g2_i3.p1 TRINITY_DN1229_c0_g2~~TRINITY_DN1229_c0_g2_i3.p1  ORF type:complete len:289 (-),score=43.49 TRINITY_DN1229_c0_g2_i3:229-1095(-)